MVNLRPACTALSVAVVLAWAVACGESSTDASNEGLAPQGSDCVDASGPNSTLLELGRVRYAPTPDPSRPALSDEEINSKFTKHLFTDVPEGGDARFASAACPYLVDSAGLRSLGHTVESLRSTKHFLREQGRSVCWTILADGRPADEVLASLASEDQAALEPQSANAPLVTGDELSRAEAIRRVAVDHVCPQLR